MHRSIACWGVRRKSLSFRAAQFLIRPQRYQTIPGYPVSTIPDLECSTLSLISRSNWTAVCRGAARWGIERCTPEAMIKSRKLRYSYGIIVTSPYDPYEHHNAVQHPVDSIERGQRIEWLLKKVCSKCSASYPYTNIPSSMMLGITGVQGDEIEEGHTLAFEAECAIQIRFGDIGHRRFCDVVLYCERDDPPERCTSGEYPEGSYILRCKLTQNG